jgi:DNA-binding CsgD family transcriptional regulator
MIEAQAAAGLTQTQAARQLGVSVNALNNVINRIGICWPRKKTGPRKSLTLVKTRTTKSERARRMLVKMGITSADDFSDLSLGYKVTRNRQIVQQAIFEGYTLEEVAGIHSISREHVGTTAIRCVISLVGREED